ncbi:MAG TPA: hypothetical protein VF208_11260, partial [Candidatus Binatia bacterium]
RSYALLSDGIRIKPYPCGGLTHQAIDSILEFRAKHGLTPEMVESVDVYVAKHTFERIVFKVPQTGIQGKFCMPYLVARALIDGKVSLHAFTEAAVREPKVLQLAERVQMHLGKDLKASDPGGRSCRVTLRTKDGQTYIREAQHAKGSPDFPLTEAELRGKFSECAREALSAEAADRALAQIEGLEKIENVRALTEILRG